ncbi:hypothetical protein C8Q76DRAFT_797227 [Earliella scabrosa]|nr:hypothetical protein C8Q76DRAFT_797227 [Earliella scabrosa]
MDPAYVALAVILYTVIIVLLRSFPQPGSAVQEHRGITVARPGSQFEGDAPVNSRPRLSITKICCQDTETSQTPERVRAAIVRNDVAGPSNVQTFSRAGSMPRNPSRSRSRSVAPVPVSIPAILAAPSLSTVTASAIGGGGDDDDNEVMSQGASKSELHHTSSTPRNSPPPFPSDQAGSSRPSAWPSSPHHGALAAAGGENMYPCLLDLNKLPSSSADVHYRDERFLPPRDETPSPDGHPDVVRALPGPLPSLESLGATISRKLPAMPLNAAASFASSFSFHRDRSPAAIKAESDDENPFVDRVSEQGTSSSSVSSGHPSSSRIPPPAPPRIPSRTVSEPVAYTRDGIAIRRHTRTVTSSNELRPPVTTPWYQADQSSDQPLDAPLRLKHELTIGELYYHRTPAQYQLWLWTDDTVKGPHWAPVKCGYKRSDGRYLIITNKDKYPSWVLRDQYVRARHDYHTHHPIEDHHREPSQCQSVTAASSPSIPSAVYLALARQDPVELADPWSIRNLLVQDVDGILAAHVCLPLIPLAKQTKVWLDVIDWSSTQPQSIEEMVDKYFGRDKEKLIAILFIVKRQLPTQHLHISKRLKPSDGGPMPPDKISPHAHSAFPSLLLDDSVRTAELQPFNRVYIGEYTANLCSLQTERNWGAALDTRHERDALVTNGDAVASAHCSDAPPSKLTLAPPKDSSGAPPPSKNRKPKKLENRAAWLGELRESKPEVAYDETLLAVVSVLIKNVATWLPSSGLPPHVPRNASLARASWQMKTVGR